MSRELKNLFHHLCPVFAIIFVLLTLPQTAKARDYIFQNSETDSKNQVVIENKSPEAEPVWVLFYQDEFIEEAYFEIPAHSKKTLLLDQIKQPAWNFSVLTKSMKVTPVNSSLNLLDRWQLKASTRFEVSLQKQSSLQMKYFNLFIERQKVTVSFLNSFGKVLGQSEFLTSSFRKSLQRTEQIPSGATKLLIESEAALSIGSSLAVSPALDDARSVSENFKYFLVQNGPGGTSFIAPIDDPQLIERAREEITNPQGYIVFAEIELNRNQANRDFSSLKKPYWSWSIKKVTGMAQIGADWCQAYPEMIERMLHGFLRQQRVCFRGQRIIRELSSIEVQTGQLKAD